MCETRPWQGKFGLANPNQFVTMCNWLKSRPKVFLAFNHEILEVCDSKSPRFSMPAVDCLWGKLAPRVIKFAQNQILVLLHRWELS